MVCRNGQNRYGKLFDVEKDCQTSLLLAETGLGMNGYGLQKTPHPLNNLITRQLSKDRLIFMVAALRWSRYQENSLPMVVSCKCQSERQVTTPYFESYLYSMKNFFWKSRD